MVTWDLRLDRDELHDKLGGGIPGGAIIVIEGENGCGKSAMLQRIVYGLTMHGRSVTYVSTELTTRGFIEQMHSLDYGVEESILDRKLLFIPVHPTFAARGVQIDPLDALLRAKAMYQNDIICIDALSTLVTISLKRNADNDKQVMRKLEDAVYLMKYLAQQGKTLILTLDPADPGYPLLSNIKAVADGLLTLEMRVVGDSVARLCMVRRFERADKRPTDIIGYRVEPGVGLLIEIASVS